MGAEPGASHARKGRPTPATRDLLAEAHATLRDELRDTLRELRPPAVESAELVLGDPLPPVRPTLADRDRLVGLIGRLMTLLGTEITPAPTETAAPSAASRPRRRARIDYG